MAVVWWALAVSNGGQGNAKTSDTDAAGRAGVGGVLGDGESEENKAFWAATPAGKLELTSILHDAFEVGRDYYLDIIPCEVGTVAAAPSGGKGA